MVRRGRRSASSIVQQLASTVSVARYNEQGRQGVAIQYTHLSIEVMQ
jgi:hypothetical protein